MLSLSKPPSRFVEFCFILICCRFESESKSLSSIGCETIVNMIGLVDRCTLAKVYIVNCIKNNPLNSKEGKTFLIKCSYWFSELFYYYYLNDYDKLLFNESTYLFHYPSDVKKGTTFLFIKLKYKWALSM